MGAQENISVEEKEYIKNFFKKKEEEEFEKSNKVFKDIEKDLQEIKKLPEYKKEEILRKIKDYGAYLVNSFDFFMRSKNVD